MKKANRLCLVPDLDVMYVGRTAWSPSSQASVPALNPSPQTVDPDRDRSGLNLNCSSSFSN